MTAGEHRPASDGQADPPRFDLECVYDDRESPAEVTIFDPHGGDLTTCWMTADLETAVSISDVV